MENTIVISDRLYLFASAFFRVDHTEWVNDHELIYEDNEDEIINRFSTRLNHYHQKVISYILITVRMIVQLYKTWIKKNDPFAHKDEGALLFEANLFTDKNSTGFKRYNGFYSGRSSDSNKQEPDDESIWGKFRGFVASFFSDNTTELQKDSHRSGRMYRGNSLD